MKPRTTPTPRNSDQPLCFALGSFHQFFTIDQAAQATPDQRIRSIWPYVLGKVRAFINTLNQRELCNYDEEDILLEVWIAIRERDHKWNPERGHFISFASPIIHNCLYGLRERTKTVKTATNVSSRLRKFQEEAEQGLISDAKRRTMQDMERSIAGPQTITDEDYTQAAYLEAPDANLLSSDEQREIVESVANVLKEVSVIEAYIIGRYLGLWGQERQSFYTIADQLDESTAAVRKIYSYAIARLALMLT